MSHSDMQRYLPIKPFQKWVQALIDQSDADYPVAAVALSLGVAERQVYVLLNGLQDNVQLSTVDRCCVIHGGMHLDTLYPYEDPMAQWPLIARLYRAGESLHTIANATGLSEGRVRVEVSYMLQDGWRLPDKRTRAVLRRHSRTAA